MPKLLPALEPGDVVLIPAGAGAAIEFIEKSGRRSRVRIECDAPVTITKRAAATARPASPAPSSEPPFARRPVPRTG